MAIVRLLKNGSEAFPAMFEALDRAQSYIALEMYVIADDETGREFRDHLINSARRNVQVMVVVDAWGSWQLQDSFWDELRFFGGRVRWFHPISRGLFPYRNHRKVLLLDDEIVYIGGMNIADEYYRGAGESAAWRDNMLEISGKEVARLRSSFIRIWEKADSKVSFFFPKLRWERTPNHRETGNVQFLESGPEDPMRPMRRIYRKVVQNAVNSIDLAMGYFYPHGRMMRVIKRAVKRGVRVRLLFPQKTDVPIARWAARGLYGRLMRAGVEVWEYKPTMMHAKLAIADDTVIAGSANLDIRSGRINYELVAVITDPALAGAARSHFEDDIRQSDRIHLEDWKKRPLDQKLKEAFSYCVLARADIFLSRTRFAKRVPGINV